MKIIAATLFSFIVSHSAFAAQSFGCPSEGEFMDQFTDLFKAAELVDIQSNPAQAEAYFKVWPAFIPNHTLYHASFERGGQDYELVGVKGGYIGRSGYLDAYTVVFEKGDSKALATIQTDTDRSDYRCSPLN